VSKQLKKDIEFIKEIEMCVDDKERQELEQVFIRMRQFKRENATMKRWLRHAETTLDMHHEHIVAEINTKLPGLFAGGKKGK